MPKIFWKNLNETTEVRSGTTILDAAIEYDLPLDHACGGCCACTTCRVYVVEGIQNLSAQLEDEKDMIENVDVPAKEGAVLRLGCQTKVLNDITIEIP